MTDTVSIPDKVALGLIAGLSGTIVMTIGQFAEMRMSGRKPSASPAKAVEKIGQVRLENGDDERRASVPIHFAYGTTLGLGLIALDGVREPWRTAAFFAAAWGAGSLLLTSLGIARPPHRQKASTLATDIGHHAVYALTAGAAYRAANQYARRNGLGRAGA